MVSLLHQDLNPPLRLGLTQWSHPSWQHHFYPPGTKSGERLARYAEVFNTVEGNTTFYASPSPQTVNNWAAAIPDSFQFTFKLPKTITHQCQLRHAQDLTADFIKLMAPLHDHIGQWTIQLPARFGPEGLASLATFLESLPREFSLGVEVRHPAFFAKGEAEKALNRLLIDHHANRVIMDSRPVFAAKPDTPAIIDAQKKKPRVPVHAIATSAAPMVRFIGHPDLPENSAFFDPWISRLSQWIAAGKTPYLMIHTSDNDQAPALAAHLYQRLDLSTPLASVTRAAQSQQGALF
ncbi:hypothetical protein BZG04_09605 [Salinivibrio kushneri]|uniref:DUF72 domain-containing protein n=1 Tax=Salinivibrio kushneri TaxID=1908198 RepID=A0AB36K3V4_9GAMM|nr:DUF72 domain-containing protein [Salinivibrio kushneri]OOE34983.1 hypothetical protein BZG04_09605 [Salinivibrio kushneri]OOE42460.1 hypothetical protein BZG09_13675 [Salinivibrio kushneri]